MKNLNCSAGQTPYIHIVDEYYYDYDYPGYNYWPYKLCARVYGVESVEIETYGKADGYVFTTIVG